MIVCEETRKAVEASKGKHGKAILPESKANARSGKIYLPSKGKHPSCETVRLTDEAAKIIEKLVEQTGQSKRYLVSELIVQGAKIIAFYSEECQSCEDRDGCPHASAARAE